MSVARRTFLATIGAGVIAAPWLHARGREASGGLRQGVEDRRADRRLAARPGMIRIDSNENPVGPGASVIAAIQRTFAEANRYPVLLEDDLRNAIAKAQGIAADNIILGCGSGELLRSAVQAFTSRDRAFVAPAPTFESPGQFAAFIGAPVKGVPVDPHLSADLSGLVSAARGAGLVYLCNPNNPTATVHAKHDVVSFLDALAAASPDTVVLVDEAYSEYVQSLSYGTVIPVALENPRVLVARTFSKVFGMAGLRVGYVVGRKDTLAKLTAFQLSSNISQLSLAAAVGALADPSHIAKEVARNHEVRTFTRKFFADAGFTMSAGEANFMMVDVRRDAKAFKATCLERGVAIGRPFPPLTTQARISFGTMPEMEKAIAVFRMVLAEPRRPESRRQRRDRSVTDAKLSHD